MKWHIVLITLFLLFPRRESVHISRSAAAGTGYSTILLDDQRVLTAYSTVCGVPPVGDATIVYGRVRTLQVGACSWGV